MRNLKAGFLIAAIAAAGLSIAISAQAGSDAEKSGRVKPSKEHMTDIEKLELVTVEHGDKISLDDLMRLVKRKTKFSFFKIGKNSELFPDEDLLSDEILILDVNIGKGKSNLKELIEKYINAVNEQYKGNLSYTIKRNSVFIAPKYEIEEKLYTRMYDVSDLLVDFESYNTPKGFEYIAKGEHVEEPRATIVKQKGYDDYYREDKNVRRLRNLITNTIQPDRWKTYGGNGSIDIYKNHMVVSQTREVLRKVERFLATLRAVKAEKFKVLVDYQEHCLEDNGELSKFKTLEAQAQLLNKYINRKIAAYFGGQFGKNITYTNSSSESIVAKTENIIKANHVASESIGLLLESGETYSICVTKIPGDKNHVIVDLKAVISKVGSVDDIKHKSVEKISKVKLDKKVISSTVKVRLGMPAVIYREGSNVLWIEISK